MNYYVTKLKFLNFIIVLVIPTLILGPFIPDLIVSISTLCFLFFLIKNKELRFFNNIPFKFFLFSVFIVYFVVCCLKMFY